MGYTELSLTEDEIKRFNCEVCLNLYKLKDKTECHSPGVTLHRDVPIHKDKCICWQHKNGLTLTKVKRYGCAECKHYTIHRPTHYCPVWGPKESKGSETVKEIQITDDTKGICVLKEII